MSHSIVFSWFKLYFPRFAKNVIEWFPNGKNSIRIVQSNKNEYIFTYSSEDEWSFETKKTYMKHMPGRR